MKELERDLKALANKRRLAILKHLKSREKATVSQLAESIELSFKSTSRHLAILFAANILVKDQRNTNMFYSIHSKQSPSVRYILSLL